MVPWELLGLIGILSLWAACALVPWFALLVLRGGRGAFATLPFAVTAGVLGGLLVAVFAKGWTGFVVSLPAATLAGAVATVAATRLTWGTVR